MEDFKDKTALVTGASTGIGAAVAIAFAARGMRVAVHYNSSADAANGVVDTIRAAGGTAFALKADVRDTAAIRECVKQAAAQLGRIDVLVNNAGSLVKRVPIAECDDALFNEVMHINARSVLAYCREVVPLMKFAAGLSRKTMAADVSASVPKRLSGTVLRICLSMGPASGG